MLPDFTAIALYEPSSGILRQSYGIWIAFGATLIGVTRGQRQSRIFLISTDAPRHFFLAFVIHIIFNCIRWFGVDVFLTAPRPARLRFK